MNKLSHVHNFLSRASTIYGNLYDISFIYICDRNFEQRRKQQK